MKRVSMVGAAVLLGTLVVAPQSSQADPSKPTAPLTVAQAQARLNQLHQQGEIASEDFNTVKVRMQSATEHLHILQADVHRQSSRVESLRRMVVNAAVSDYQSANGLSTSASFLAAKNPQQFMDSLASNAVVEHRQTGMLTQLTQQQKQLGLQQAQARSELAAIARDKQRLAAHKAQLDRRTHEAQQLLNSLQAKQRARLLALQSQAQTTYTTGSATTLSRDSQRPTINVPASGRAAVAVNTALAQLGKPYVYGGAGPDVFDCSGLTMYAWAAAGVALPHSAAAQTGYGTPVSISQLQPGDLVFYYSPIHHVAMYIGNGNVVHAPYPGTVVQIAPLQSMPITMAVHIG
ncbi:MAG: NlpC/P60 family protein [Nocardioidaceae bacterium]